MRDRGLELLVTDGAKQFVFAAGARVEFAARAMLRAVRVIRGRAAFSSRSAFL
jgi:hypothetical protein